MDSTIEERTWTIGRGHGLQCKRAHGIQVEEKPWSKSRGENMDYR
jgi:hypothetical protein